MHSKIAELHVLATQGNVHPSIILESFNEAYLIDKKQTIQILMFIRDKNNWVWQRDFVRRFLLWLLNKDPEVFNKVVIDFVMVGRWDDIFFNEYMLTEHTLSIIKNHLELWNSLIKKWLPKESSNPTLARAIAKGIWYTMKQYRLAIKNSDWPFINTLYRPISSYYVNI